jgi:hypothetical protein
MVVWCQQLGYLLVLWYARVCGAHVSIGRRCRIECRILRDWNIVADSGHLLVTGLLILKSWCLGLQDCGHGIGHQDSLGKLQ